MPFRFSRRFNILPGLRINVSKSGVSQSIGTKGAWFTIGPRGTRATVGLPGTGLSYTEQRKSDAGDVAMRRFRVHRTSIHGGGPMPNQTTTSRLVMLVFSLGATLPLAQSAAAVSVDFENFTTSGVSVDAISTPGVQFSGAGWITSQITSPKFTTVFNRVIAAFPDGGAPLTMQFAVPQRNVRFGLGSGISGEDVTVAVTGFLGGNQVSSQSFTTSLALGCSIPPCGEEALIQLAGPVDRIVLVRTAGTVGPFIDNLQGSDVAQAIPTMTSWGRAVLIALLAMGSIVYLRTRRLAP